jgi:hypothetical protein
VGGVEAGPGEVAQPFLEFWREWVRGSAGDLCSDQLPPSPFGMGVCGGESLVELLLEASGLVAAAGRSDGRVVRPAVLMLASSL